MYGTDEQRLQMRIGLLAADRGDLSGGDERDDQRDNQDREAEVVGDGRSVPAESAERLSDPG
jgi:hypothetical protein